MVWRSIIPRLRPTSSNLSFRQAYIRPRPIQVLSARQYARYSRFEDDQGRRNDDGPEDEHDRQFRRYFEYFRLYGVGALIAGGGTIWYVTHLEQVPETKRWRYMDASPKMIQLLEKQSYTELMQEFGKYILPMNHPATRLVQSVAETLITKNGLGHVVTRDPGSTNEQKDDEWLVYVVDQDIQNAFVMPGRKIVVFSGMLKQVEDADQLAGILAHEVAHQLVGHVLEKISLTRLIVVIDIAIQFLIGTTTNLSGIALTALVALPNSRTQELEADLVGLRLMSKACFNPDAVVRFWRSFDKQDKKQPPQFLSTHPGHKQRATAIEGWAPTVRSEYPCVDVADFSRAFREQEPRSEDIRKPEAPPYTPPSQSPASKRPPSRSPSPSSDSWGTQDPWAQGSGSSDGGESDWGHQDPWATKNGNGRSKSW